MPVIDILSEGEIKLKDRSNITVSAGRDGGDCANRAPKKFADVARTAVPENYTSWDLQNGLL